MLDEMERRFEAMPDATAVRRCTVENVFGIIKGRVGASHFRTRGAEALPLHVVEIPLWPEQ